MEVYNGTKNLWDFYIMYLYKFLCTTSFHEVLEFVITFEELYTVQNVWEILRKNEFFFFKISLNFFRNAFKFLERKSKYDEYYSEILWNQSGSIYKAQDSTSNDKF